MATPTDLFRWKVRIEEVKSGQYERISFLAWSKDTFSAESTSSLLYTDLQGHFTKKTLQVTLNSKALPVKEDGSFDVHFGVPATTKTFVITAIDEDNKIYRSEFKIVPIDEAVDTNQMGVSLWRYSAGGGLTLLSYRQKNVTPFSQDAFTVKGGATYRAIPGKLDLGLSAFFNLIPFGSQSPLNYNLQYLGVNLRAGYILLGAPSSIRVTLNAGLYFNTSFSAIGFLNMYGPQLYPEVVYVFENGNSLLLYGKYSPAVSQSQAISLNDNREVAIGLHYSFPVTVRNRVSVGFDISQLSLSTATDWATTNTYSLSSGISF